MADAAQAVAEGLVLGGYQYLEYKGDATPSKLKKVTIIAAGGAPVKAAVERGATVGDAVTWARDLVNTPAIDKTPSDMASAARKLLRGTGVTVQILDVRQLQAQRMGGVLGVAPGFGPGAPVPQDDVRARPVHAASRSHSSARVWCSTPVVCR